MVLIALLACVLDRVAPTLLVQRALASGAFLLRIAFPQAYPFHPFQVRLITPLYHPTVGPGGIMAVIGSEPYPSSSFSSTSSSSATDRRLDRDDLLRPFLLRDTQND